MVRFCESCVGRKISGDLSGVGGLTKLDAGNLTLSGGSTYSGTTTVSAGTLVVSAGTAVLMSGRVEGMDETQPVTVARKSDGGGRVVYTSLGHPDEFKLAWFNRMLAQAVEWTCGERVEDRDAK